jgi:hypothetical protein
LKRFDDFPDLNRVTTLSARKTGELVSQPAAKIRIRTEIGTNAERIRNTGNNNRTSKPTDKCKLTERIF